MTDTTEMAIEAFTYSIAVVFGLRSIWAVNKQGYFHKRYSQPVIKSEDPYKFHLLLYSYYAVYAACFLKAVYNIFRIILSWTGSVL